MDVFVFPYGVALVPAIAATLDIEKYRITYQKIAAGRGSKKFTKYDVHVDKFFHMVINETRCVIFPRYTLGSIIRERRVNPRFVVESGGKHIIDHNLQTRPDFKLYDYQTSISDVVCNTYMSPERLKMCKASCLIKLDTGLGKSFIIAEVIRRTRFRTVIIVPQIELAKQFADDLKSVFENLTVTTGVDIHADVNILVINTALMYDKEYYKLFGLVVFDEVPLYCTDTRRAIFFHAKQNASIGMSATPYRRDNLHILLADHLGPVVDQADFDQIKSEFSIEYTKHDYRTPTQYMKPNKYESTNSVSFMLSCRDCLTFDTQRNTMIAELSYGLYKRCRPHFIFTIIADHARFLAEFINNYIAEKTQDRSSPQITTLAGSDPVYGIRNSSIIVATYHKGGVGISINTMLAAIWAMVPFETQYTQVVGRITRRNAKNPEADKIVREIHIVRDSAPWLRDHFEKIDDRLRIGQIAADKPYASPFDNTPFD